MKLYNIYESIILEETTSSEEGTLLIEGNKEDVIAAIDGTYEVWFKYKDEKGGVTDRYVQIHQYGKSKSGKDMISAWQKGGKTAKTKEDNTNAGWKQFRLDRIVVGSITPTKMKFHNAISDAPSFIKGATTDSGKVKDDYNDQGNDNMTGTVKSVDFNK